MSTRAAIKRLTGFRWAERNRRGWEARFRWGSVTSGWGLSLALCSFEEGFSLHLHLGYPNIFISLPMLHRWHHEPDEIMDAWGFSIDPVGSDSVHLNWGSKTKIIHFPWKFDWHRTSYLEADQTWRHDLAAEQRAANKLGRDVAIARSNERWAARDRDWSEVHPYRYVLLNGTVQDRTATIKIRETEWRRKFLRWTRLGAMVRRTIEVEFSGEVGERSGSWKGGCIGCSYDLRPGEQPVEALRRMERERTF